MESNYALMAVSSSEEEESLLISISISCLYKEQKHSFKRLAIVTRLNDLVSRISCMCIFTVSFGSFQFVNSLRDCTKCAF